MLLEASNAIVQNSQGFFAFVEGNLGLLLAAIILVVATIVLIVFIKQFLINSVLGLIAWSLLYYVFQIKLPFWASFIVSLIFGLAGIGVMLFLKFLGVAF